MIADVTEGSGVFDNQWVLVEKRKYKIKVRLEDEFGR
jgi:hypothetical protein